MLKLSHLYGHNTHKLRILTVISVKPECILDAALLSFGRTCITVKSEAIIRFSLEIRAHVTSWHVFFFQIRLAYPCRRAGNIPWQVFRTHKWTQLLYLLVCTAKNDNSSSKSSIFVYHYAITWEGKFDCRIGRMNRNNFPCCKACT